MFQIGQLLTLCNKLLKSFLYLAAQNASAHPLKQEVCPEEGDARCQLEQQSPSGCRLPASAAGSDPGCGVGESGEGLQSVDAHLDQNDDSERECMSQGPFCFDSHTAIHPSPPR